MIGYNIFSQGKSINTSDAHMISNSEHYLLRFTNLDSSVSKLFSCPRYNVRKNYHGRELTFNLIIL